MHSRRSRPSTARLAALVAAVVAAAVVVAPAASSAAGTVTFGIQAASGGKGDQRTDFQFGGGPGSAPFHDEVAVVNIGSVPLTLSLYAADAATTSNGTFSAKLPTVRQTDVGSWITLAHSATVKIPARTTHGPSRVFVPFTLTIPRSASPGDHVGAIFVSLHSGGGTSARASEALNQRVGIRVYVRVSGTVRASLSIVHLSSSFSPFISANPIGTGTEKVSYIVRNNGNVILGASQSVTVDGLVGGSRTPAPLPQLGALLPGDSVKVSTSVTGVFPEFLETTKVVLHPLIPIGAVDTSLKAFSASNSSWAVPWTLIALVVLVLAASGWYLRRRLAPSGSHSKNGAKA